MKLPYALLFVVLLASAAAAQERELLIAGWDQEQGWFSGTLHWTPTDPARQTEVSIERQRRFLNGVTEVLTGSGRVRDNWVRGELQRHAGAIDAVEVALGGRAPRSPVVLQVKLSLETGAAETISWIDGRRVSRARGRTVGLSPPPAMGPPDGPLAEHYVHSLAIENPLDPYFVPLRGGVDGEPSLEGSDAEGFRSWRGVPFVKGRNDEHAIDKNDVAQGSIGNCYLLAAMVSVAHSDPDVIERMIEANDDGSYTVNLWDVGVFSGDARIRVEPTFPYQTQGGRKVPVFTALGDRQTVDRKHVYELWPMIVEKAWAKFRGSYAGTEDWHSSGPLSFISGAEVRNLDPADMTADEILAVLHEAIEKGYPTVLSSDTYKNRPQARREGNAISLVDFHAYSVVGKTQDGRIKLWNPWGSNHPRRALKGQELKRLFMCIHIGQF